MKNKEKITTLVSMGFTADEALALVNGNYRTVPDTEDGSTSGTDPDHEDGSGEDPSPVTMEQITGAINEAVTAAVTDMKKDIISANLLFADNKAPKGNETPDDILAKIINPTIGEENKNGSK